jgi:hypothetical protein
MRCPVKLVNEEAEWIATEQSESEKRVSVSQHIHRCRHPVPLGLEYVRMLPFGFNIGISSPCSKIMNFDRTPYFVHG